MESSNTENTSGNDDAVQGDPLTPSSPSSQSWVQFDNDEKPGPPDNNQSVSPTTPPTASPTAPPATSASLPPPLSRAAVVAAAAASTPAVIDAHSVQVTLGGGKPHPIPAARVLSEPGVRNGTPNIQPISTPLTSPPLPQQLGVVSPLAAATTQLQNVPLNERTEHTTPASNIRQGFANGDVIVTLLPQNTSMAWISPARFRPELVPEELMAQGLTLTVEDYVHIMTQLVNDDRFKLFNICYKRIVIAWIMTGFIILLTILFTSGGKQLELFGAGIAWLLLNAGAIFLCMWIKIRLNRGLERCMSSINLQLMKHKILLGLDDRGKLSCHKVNLCFIYFDTTPCLGKLQQLIDEDARATAAAVNTAAAAATGSSLQARLDIDDPDIIITGATNTRISREQDRSMLLLAKYSQRWAKDYLRKRLDWAFDALARVEGLSPPTPPRHLSTARCLCQYIENHLGVKSMQKQKEQESRKAGCCGSVRSFFKDVNEL
uniref:Transmembrane protein C9orf91 homolog n=2 Tax=Hirondellea gigas TaxID=1518452 RepID=A0A6A7FRJ2_9CRUS